MLTKPDISETSKPSPETDPQPWKSPCPLFADPSPLTKLAPPPPPGGGVGTGTGGTGPAEADPQFPNITNAIITITVIRLHFVAFITVLLTITRKRLNHNGKPSTAMLAESN